VSNFRLTPPILIFLAAFCSLALADDVSPDLPKKAAERSQITLRGSHPFVLKAKVSEVTNPSNANYQAEIEEYWVAPDKWRRVVKASGFSETITVNGTKTSDELTGGDYSPNWLRTIVEAIFDPGAEIKGLDLSLSKDNPVLGGSRVCRRFNFMAGVPPVSNKVFSSFCFDDGLIDSIAKPGYQVTYKNYKNFAGKHVARTISENIESGTVVEATIEDLTELNAPDDSMFVVQAPSALVQTIRADEPTLRSLALNAPEIVWPAVRSGANSGTLSLYVCVDRTGHVREIYELNSSNPGLSDAARDQVMKWQFKPASTHGAPVQVEAILTFAFKASSASK
jgi:TonB-like protein